MPPVRAPRRLAAVADPDRRGGASRAPSARACPCAGDCPRCAGRSLPAPLAGSLSRHLGTDLASVRLHTGAAAEVAAAGAKRAFAQGNDIVLAASQLGAQETTLLAHEAVHVVQQRGGSGRGSSRGSCRGSAPTVSLEAEAQRSAAAFASGRWAPPVQAGRAAAGVPQFDEPAGGTATADEEPSQLRAQFWFADWLAQQQQQATAGGSVPLRWLEPRSLLGAEKLDVGSLYTPYHDRNLFPGGGLALRDTPLIDRLFTDRLHFVSMLPEVRHFVPSFARSWIPSNWRVDMAATLTSTTIDWALSNDAPNFFEISNRGFERFTGATTYSTPMLKVPVLNSLWNRFTGGGR